jgi:ATP-binding cassette subfamily B protein
MKCGIACLQMVCDFHGRKISEARLSNLCFATAEGVSLLGISEAATELGFKTIAGKVLGEICRGGEYFGHKPF